MFGPHSYTPLTVCCEANNVQDRELEEVGGEIDVLEEASRSTQAPNISRTRKLIFGAIAATSCCLLGLTAKKVYGGCIPDESLLGLPEFESKVELNPVPKTPLTAKQAEWSHNVVAHWLKLSEEVRQIGFKDPEQENELIDKALQDIENSSGLEAGQIMQNVLHNSAAISKDHRDALKKFAETFVDTMNDIKDSNLSGTLEEGPFGKSPGRKAADGFCTFDILSILSYLALAGSDINDAVRTCEGVKFGEFVQGTHVHDKICGLNVLTAVGNVAGSAAVISAAAMNCADTLLLKTKPICSASLIGLVGTLAQLAGSLSITNAACHPWRSWYGRIDKDLRASEIGSNWVTRERGETYVADLNPIRFENGHLHIGLKSAPPPAENSSETPGSRRLLFGGGKPSIMAQCVIDAAQIAWGLAYFALHLNSIANTANGQSCPARNFAGQKHGFKDLLYWSLASYCTVDIFAMIGYLTQVVAYITLGIIHCSDYLNLKAMCAEGINGIVAALAGMGLSSAGVHVACHYYRTWPQDALLKIGHTVDKWSKGTVSYWYGTGMGGTNFAPLKYFVPTEGRRLEEQNTTRGAGDNAREQGAEGPPPEMEEVMKMLHHHYAIVERGIADVKSRFSTPDEAYASIGLNMSDPNAEWRKVKHPKMSLSDLTKLTEKRPRSDEKKGFFEQPTCKT